MENSTDTSDNRFEKYISKDEKAIYRKHFPKEEDYERALYEIVRHRMIVEFRAMQYGTVKIYRGEEEKE